MTGSVSDHTALIKSLASKLGFTYCGIAKAVKLDEDARRLEQWLKNGMQGSMKFMENHFELRIDPTKLVPGAKSVITLLYNYFPAETLSNASYKVARYAYGDDYHDVIRNQLKELLHLLEEKTGPVNGRGFVDSAPVLERSWALRSGLGWIGKNGNIINKNSGSYFFIATLITDLELSYDDPYVRDHCGSCTKCIDACPTQAIKPGKVVDGSSCISYFTIELKDALIPHGYAGKFENWMFGCDICQEVCPWNRFSKPHDHIALRPGVAITASRDTDWEELTEENFKKHFKHSPLKRTGYKGLMRNIHFLKQQPDEPAGE